MVYLCTKQITKTDQTMKRKCCIALLTLITIVVVLPSKSSAQDYEYEYSAESYYEQYGDNGIEGKNITLPTRNEIRIGAGAPGATSILNLQGLLLGVTGNSHFSLNDFFSPDTKYITPLSFEYNRYRKKWLVVGVKMHYSSVERDLYDPESGEYQGRVGNHLIGAMANWRFEYLRREHVQLYSGCAVGIGIRFTDIITLPTLLVDWTYIGVAFGSKVFGYTELGGGIGGFLRAGIGLKF